jgi:hypothetical protein
MGCSQEQAAAWRLARIISSVIRPCPSACVLYIRTLPSGTESNEVQSHRRHRRKPKDSAKKDTLRSLLAPSYSHAYSFT